MSYDILMLSTMVNILITYWFQAILNVDVFEIN